MYRIRKSFTFEAAHQLETAVTAACHECIHGHSYTVELVISSHLLNRDRMVMDFAELRDFKDAIMEELDHGLLLHENKRPHFQPLIDEGVLKAGKVSFHEENPTAEYIARMIFHNLTKFVRDRVELDGIGRGVKAETVRVHETSTGWAEYGLDWRYQS